MGVPEVGAVAPHFTLPGLDGREYSHPGTPSGRPLLIVFAKTGCGACDLALPYLGSLRSAYAGGWDCWVVMQDQPEATASYAEEVGVTGPVLIDAPGYEVSRLYDPPATPTFFLVAPDGRVAYESHGFAKVDINEISRLIAELTGSSPVEVATEGDGNPPMRPG